MECHTKISQVELTGHAPLSLRTYRYIYYIYVCIYYTMYYDYDYEVYYDEV